MTMIVRFVQRNKIFTAYKYGKHERQFSQESSLHAAIDGSKASRADASKMLLL